MSTCIHHWLIVEPIGPTSPGRCLRCDARGLFRNRWRPTERAYLRAYKDWLAEAENGSYIDTDMDTENNDDDE